MLDGKHLTEPCEVFIGYVTFKDGTKEVYHTAQKSKESAQAFFEIMATSYGMFEYKDIKVVPLNEALLDSGYKVIAIATVPTE